MRLIRRKPGLVLSAVLACVGCGGAGPTGPAFEYQWEDPEFWPPDVSVAGIAVGDAGVIDVAELSGASVSAVDLSSAVSDRPEVLRVDRVAGRRIFVSALAPGRASLHVRARDGREDDTGPLAVATVHRVEVRIPEASSPSATPLRTRAASARCASCFRRWPTRSTLSTRRRPGPARSPSPSAPSARS